MRSPREIGGDGEPGRQPAAVRLLGRVRAWDLAAAVGSHADFTVGIRMAHTGDGRFYVEDMVRGRWAPGDRDQIILRTAHLDGKSVPVLVEEEPGSAGKSVTASLVRLLVGFPIQGVRSTGSKTIRAMPFASQARAGNVKLVRAPWNADWIYEVVAFDKGVHDDIVDASSLAFNALAGATAALPYAWLRHESPAPVAAPPARLAVAERTWTPGQYRVIEEHP